MASIIPEDLELEYARVLTTAKEALKYIGVFRTPPTPGIYDVWYRYVEGSDTALHEQLSHAVTVSKTVSKELLEFFHQQKIAESAGVESIANVRDILLQEIASLTALISTQLDANKEFDKSIRTAQDSLDELIPSPLMIRNCIDQLVQSNQKMQGELTTLQRRMEGSQSQIDALKDRLLESQKAILTDPLTGIGNRRYFDVAVKQAVSRRLDRSRPLYMLLVDLDKLKFINDTYGYLVGDDVLKHTAAVIEKMFPNASIARLGGDEFVIIVHVENHVKATELSNHLCRHFSNKEFQSNRIGERLGQVTLSIGAGQLRGNDDELTWFDRTDKLLSSAKKSGGNQAMVERELL